MWCSVICAAETPEQNLVNRQRWRVWKKVVPDKEAHEDKVINDPLEVELETLWWIGYSHVKAQIFPQNPRMK